MSKSRLEAFSDGVFAILLTILVLELKVPHGAGWEALFPLIPTLLAYVLSFIYVGIYWNNHHHMLHLTEKIDGRILWANLHLLFWLSLVPFATGWLGENHFAALPTALYGTTLFMTGTAYFMLQGAIISHQGPASPLRKAIGEDWKGKASSVANGVAIPLAFVNNWVSLGIYVAIALLWFAPDQRIEKALQHH
jgi:uncharacterized membrane protein